MGSDFNLSFGELKKLSNFEGSDSSIHRYRSVRLIEFRRVGKRVFYSKKSVMQLQLIPRLQKYSLQIQDIKDAFETVPLAILNEKVGKIAPDELLAIVISYKNKQIPLFGGGQRS